ncbi:hypothetical protein V3851_19600, partial [Paenibacillus sp. M1]
MYPFRVGVIIRATPNEKNCKYTCIVSRKADFEKKPAKTAGPLKSGVLTYKFIVNAVLLIFLRVYIDLWNLVVSFSVFTH